MVILLPSASFADARTLFKIASANFTRDASLITGLSYDASITPGFRR
jgi:hypothetical protein